MNVEDFIVQNMPGIEAAFQAGSRNFTYTDENLLTHSGVPFAVWLIDTDCQRGLDLAKAIARASHRSRRLGDAQISAWQKKCRKSRRAPVMAAALPISRSYPIAKSIAAKEARELLTEPSPAEFWVVVVTGSVFACVAVDKPLIYGV